MRIHVHLIQLNSAHLLHNNDSIITIQLNRAIKKKKKRKIHIFKNIHSPTSKINWRVTDSIVTSEKEKERKRERIMGNIFHLSDPNAINKTKVQYSYIQTYPFNPRGGHPSPTLPFFNPSAFLYTSSLDHPGWGRGEGANRPKVE